VALAFYLLYRFAQVIFILLIAIVLGTVIRPLVTWLHERGFSRTVGVISIYATLLALVIGFLFLLFPLIIEQGTTIAAAVPGYYQSLRNWMLNTSNPLIMRLSEFVPPTLPGLMQQAVQPTEPDVMTSAGRVLGYITSASQVGFFALVSLVLAFYWTLDGPRAIKSLLLLIPQDKRDDITELISAMEAKVSSYVAGQAILCLVVGIMALIAYLVIGLPNALVLALIICVLEAVPMIGPLMGAVPAVLVGFSLGPDRAIWVIVASIVIQQLENSLLVPRIMNKTVGVNPFVSVLAFFSFSSLMGMAGALMAIPLAAILQLLLDRFVFQAGITEAEVSTGRDYLSRLRYEAQDLAQDLRKQARLKKDGPDLVVKQVDQILDEIEVITTDLDSLLAQAGNSDVS
jgi:predicted PurR-regulated permease PerM